MENIGKSTLLTKNHLGKIQPDERVSESGYLEAVKAFSRLTYESIYVIDYETMSFEYVSENPLFLCGYSSAEVMAMGYDFYFKNVPESDLNLLHIINEAGFDFFAGLRRDERSLYSITYDFHVRNREGKNVLINHKLTPLLLTNAGKMWKAMCKVSISHHRNAGNVYIYRQSSDIIWQFDLKERVWRKQEKPKLTKREVEVLHLYARGLSISEIAVALSVTVDTVKYYRRQIFDRLNVGTIAEALAYSVNSKIV